MTSRTLQELVDQAKPPRGSRTTCRNCGQGFTAWSGHLWCRLCRELISCAHLVTIHGYMIKRDGVRSGKRWCVTCGSTRDTRREEGYGSVLFYDLRTEEEVPPCSRCGSRNGTQLHHWAPRAIFGGIEADRWPTAHLCPTCHALWHRLMRLAAGVRLPPEQRIEDYGTPRPVTSDFEDVA